MHQTGHASWKAGEMGAAGHGIETAVRSALGGARDHTVSQLLENVGKRAQYGRVTLNDNNDTR